MTQALLLIGAPGAGKSSVLEALAALLEIDEVPHGAIETEQLSRGWPLLSSDSWIEQLETTLELQRRAGRQLFLIVATVESARDLRTLVAAAGAERVLVVSLQAPPDLLAERLAEREPDTWPGKQGLIEHARELAPIVAQLDSVDVAIDTATRGADDVAGQIREQMRARGMLDFASDVT